MMGLDGRILRPGSFLKSLGYGRRILGMNFMDLTHPDDHGISKAVHGWLLDGHSRLIVSKRYIDVAGTVIPTTMHVELVHDGQGRPRYMRAWPADSGEDWGAASTGPRIRTQSAVCEVREGFVAQPIESDPGAETRPARRVGRLVLPPELL